MGDHSTLPYSSDDLPARRLTFVDTREADTVTRWQHIVATVAPDGTGLDPLGRDGWEAVGVVTSRVDGFSVLMKRPLPAEDLVTEAVEAPELVETHSLNLKVNGAETVDDLAKRVREADQTRSRRSADPTGLDASDRILGRS